jgi:hypothetical protein
MRFEVIGGAQKVVGGIPQDDLFGVELQVQERLAFIPGARFEQ